MANPNIKGPSSVSGVYGETDYYDVTTTLATFLTNPANSSELWVLDNILCTNVDGVNPADLTLVFNNGTGDGHVCRTLSVPADATQVNVTRDIVIRLKEGQSLKAQASANSDLQLVYSYVRIVA